MCPCSAPTQIMENELISALLPSAIGFAGVVIGVALSTISNWILKKKEARLRVLEIVFSKRMKAYEDLLELAKLMNTVVSTRSIDSRSIVITYSGILANRDIFDGYYGKLYDVINQSHWFEKETSELLYYVQDYIENINILLKDSDIGKWVDVGTNVKIDIRELAGEIERHAKKFFLKDIYKMKIQIRDSYVEKDATETSNRLKKTRLYNIYLKNLSQ